MGNTYSTHTGDENRNLNVRDHVAGLGVDKRMILKCISEK